MDQQLAQQTQDGSQIQKMLEGMDDSQLQNTLKGLDDSQALRVAQALGQPQQLQRVLQRLDHGRTPKIQQTGEFSL
jgi:methionyl-tRNA formyltransferase